MPGVSETTPVTEPAHLSWSQLSTWSHCPKSYQLSKVLGLAERPGIARAGGHAVHAAIEAFNLKTLA